MSFIFSITLSIPPSHMEFDWLKKIIIFFENNQFAFIPCRFRNYCCNRRRRLCVLVSYWLNLNVVCCYHQTKNFQLFYFNLMLNIRKTHIHTKSCNCMSKSCIEIYVWKNWSCFNLHAHVFYRPIFLTDPALMRSDLNNK